MQSIKKQAMWLFSATCFSAVLQIIQLGVVARTLTTKELGIVAIINSILSIAMVLQDMGMSSYLIHRQQLTSREQSTIFWVNAMLGAITAALLVLIALPISWFYKIPELSALITLTSLNFLILGLLSQYQAHYIKAKRAILLSRIEMFAKLISVAFTIALLYFTPLKASAIILGLFFNAVIRFLCMLWYADKDWHPTFEFSYDTFKAALRYGSFQLGSQIINQLRTQADSLLIGKFLGAEILGIYSLAKDLILQPLKLISPVINRLALPRFAERQNSHTEMINFYLRSSRIICIISAIMFLLIGLLSPVVVRILYGANHQQVAQLIPYMLLLGVLRPMGGLTGAISQANGKTHVEFYWNIIAGVIMITIMSAALFWHDIVYMAIALSFSQVAISFFVYPFFIKPIVNVAFYPYMKTWFPATLLFIIGMLIINHWNLYIHF
ncbi:lipopolysaccharide biosynthesis protein [Acerihabitans arboris]|uniref:Oligosaccharide flippase family protein n=1 Tax=Acerihabitans arboris TaxID=2691583 RepID=A0A845SRP2_9GAMM|nr:lipopolysaccharide biosynthesis protein [Acerihabitans arboris]NDL66012.1 oligosaccharide flippase family protein [Acerihabitans arboris]